MYDNHLGASQVWFQDVYKSYTCSVHLSVESGEDALDALSCRSLFAKEPLIVGLFCGK